MCVSSKIATLIKACLIITLMVQQVTVIAFESKSLDLGVCGANDDSTNDDSNPQRTEDAVTCSGCGHCKIESSRRLCDCCSKKKSSEPPKQRCCSGSAKSANQVADANNRPSRLTPEPSQPESPSGCKCLRTPAAPQESKRPSPSNSRDQILRQAASNHSYALPSPNLTNESAIAWATQLGSERSFVQRTLCVWLL